MSSDVVFACAAGSSPEQLPQAARLLMSLRWFGGSAARAPFVLGCTGPIPEDAGGLFRHYGAKVIRIPLAPSSSCRIALLESPALAGYETVVLIDPNTIVVADPSGWLAVAGVAARVTGTATGRSLDTSLDTGVVLVDARHRGRLAAEWERRRGALCEPPHGEFSRNRADQASLALAVDHAGLPFHALPGEMNLPAAMDTGPVPQHPAVIQYSSGSGPSGYLTPPGAGAVSHHIEAFNARLRASGHARLPAAGDIGLRGKVQGNRRPKVVVGSGWWCNGRPHEWTIGAVCTRSIAFFDVWYRQVLQCLQPERIVVTDSASPVKPDHLSYAGVQWIELDRNYGHPNDVRTGIVQTKYSGFTRSVINGAMHALCCDADYYVYVEQDCLLHGEDFLAHSIGNATEDILLGPPTENGRGMGGKIAAPMIQQSLMIVARSGLERFLDGLLGAPWTDGQRPPEEIMRLRLPPYGHVQVPYGRSRPIDFTRSHYYAQHLVDDELAQFLAHAGIDLPERAFPFRAGEVEAVEQDVPAA